MNSNQNKIKIPKDKTCWDCHCEIELDDEGNIKNGKLLKYRQGDKEYIVFKCNKCFEEDPALRNFKEAEVFTRCVGYLRPVKQFNPGKQEEVKERKMFKL